MKYLTRKLNLVNTFKCILYEIFKPDCNEKNSVYILVKYLTIKLCMSFKMFYSIQALRYNLICV